MNISKIACIIIGITIVAVGCSPLKQIETAKTSALQSFDNKQYSEAYNQLKVLIEKYKQSNIPVSNQLLLKTAECAKQTADYSGASNYYSQALKDSASVIAVKGYINSLNKTSNYDKVSEALNTYGSLLSDNNEIEYLNITGFNNAVDKVMHEKVVAVYPKLSNPSENQSMSYLSSLEQLGRKKEAVKFCNQLVKDNPSYFKAKEWKAIYYYKFAEQWYKSEMDKYNKDKNYTAYVYLKRELKKISANYRVAKNLFEELNDKYPDEKKYMRYLKNTYLRLEMKKEAAAMDKLLKQ